MYHPVKKKIRVVFDCSSKHNGLNLNDALLQGPDLTNSLIGVLMRFCQNRVAVICDIAKIFYQFRVDKEHRDVLQFLWWPEGNLLEQVNEYRMTVHVFGATSSPG